MNKEKKTITNPLVAIRARCLDCCVYQPNEVKLCPVKDCPLYAFRFGKNPYRKQNLTEEQRKERSERMKAMRKNQINKENQN